VVKEEKAETSKVVLAAFMNSMVVIFEVCSCSKR
jgi:hypothetical protein